MVIKTILSVLSLFVMLSCSMTGKKGYKTAAWYVRQITYGG